MYSGIFLSANNASLPKSAGARRCFPGIYPLAGGSFPAGPAGQGHCLTAKQHFHI
jgi:hypothetical protein